MSSAKQNFLESSYNQKFHPNDHTKDINLEKKVCKVGSLLSIMMTCEVPLPVLYCGIYSEHFRDPHKGM